MPAELPAVTLEAVLFLQEASHLPNLARVHYPDPSAAPCLAVRAYSLHSREVVLTAVLIVAMVLHLALFPIVVYLVLRVLAILQACPQKVAAALLLEVQLQEYFPRAAVPMVPVLQDQ